MNKKIMVGLAILVFFVILLWSGASFYADWLWFQSLDFSPVFWTTLLSKSGIASVSWLVFMLIMAANIIVARRIQPAQRQKTDSAYADGTALRSPFTEHNINILIIGVILFVSLMVASRSAFRWDMILLYLNQQPFGGSDPIFNRDIGFYVYSLPFYFFVQKGLLIFSVLATLATAWWYLKSNLINILDEMAQGKPPGLFKIDLAPKARMHIVFLAGIVVLLIGWGFYLKTFGLLYSTEGAAFGAGYTDVNVRILGYRIIGGASFVWALIIFFNGRNFRKKMVLLTGGIWLGIVLLFWSILPVLVQQFFVNPNELVKESAYIAHNIKNTRAAFNLDKILETDFKGNQTLSQADIDRHDTTISNIRIWDERPLLQTYRQIQSIRLYYDFLNVDVDRYFIDNQYRQVMLAARELVVDQLPPQANTWVNRHLIYTHGYGVAASPVNEVTKEGLPQLLIKDLPPTFTTDLKISRPEIYYGEKSDAYVLVKTKTKEFDYPKGDKNVYTHYQGSGGVLINSLFRRLLFAFEFLDPQILFTNYLGPESRIMFKRRIDWRTRAIAPFLDYDGDPYMVIANGKLYWIQDAYTTSNMYPYSRRAYGQLENKPLNYIRNSVKVIIDAYNGDIFFYLIDTEDPLAKTYAKIFPDLFKSFDDMPAALKRHMRYPKDLFKIQVEAYKTYHMDEVQVFYNQEDLWSTPDELYGDSRQEMEPYYIILKLPDQEKEEFLLMQPFTPSKKDNMIGWLAARSDLPGYGNLLVYKLPKEKLVYGPMQIEARVDQQTSISRELSLWGQRGSRVIRGNLLAIPLEGAFIYVEPVYLEARQEEKEAPPPAQQKPGLFGGSGKKQARPAAVSYNTRSSALPELKRVIVGIGNRIVMEETLDKALAQALGAAGVSPKALAVVQSLTATKAVPATEIGTSGQAILAQYKKAKAAMREGDWNRYGQAMQILEEMLNEEFGQQVKGRQP
jgi:uncharacterized protein